MYQTKNMELEMIECPKCGSDFPKLRRDKYGYNFCINCSTESPKRGVPVMKGKGDHTWVELDIMTQEQYENYEKLNKKSSKLDKTKE
jgi:hypothetical protein